MLLILSVCMTGFTSMASTTLTEQKQETIFVETIQTQEIVNVETFTIFSFENVTIFQSDYALEVKNQNPSFVADVGWPDSKKPFSEIVYNEKLSGNYNLNFVHKLNAPNYLVRDRC